MAAFKAKCHTQCWDNVTLYYPHRMGPDGKEIEYDIDPAEPWAIHFTFTDLKATDIRNANDLSQKKAILELSLGLATRSLADEVMLKQAELNKINQALHNTPNAIKAAAGLPETVKGQA